MPYQEITETTEIKRPKSFIGKAVQFLIAGFRVRGQLRNENVALRKDNKQERISISKELLATKKERIALKRAIIKQKRIDKLVDQIREHNQQFKSGHESASEIYDKDLINKLFGKEENIKTGILNSRIQSLTAGFTERLKIFNENTQFRRDNKLATKDQVNENMKGKGTRIKDDRDIIRAEFMTQKVNDLVGDLSNMTQKVDDLSKMTEVSNPRDAVVNYKAFVAGHNERIEAANKKKSKASGVSLSVN